jgi:hypothetical protein
MPTQERAMTWLLNRLMSAKAPKPVFAEENAERAMRMAELKWLLAEIAAPAETRPWLA